jgi:hypothetical protein
MAPMPMAVGDGDGRINLDLEICNRWDVENGNYTFSTVFPGVDHPGIIHNEAVLQSIESIVRVQVSGAVTTLPNLWLFHIAIYVRFYNEFVKTIFY